MTFSIIMPIYNVERYLEASIQCVLSQGFEDFELLLLNDASPDGCGALCEAYAKKDPRVRYVSNDHNLGVCATRNMGIAMAKGDWIWFVDPDDKVCPGALETLAHSLTSGLDVMFFGFQYVIESGDYQQRTSKTSMPAPNLGKSTKEFAAFVLKNDLQHTFSPIWNKVYRRDFLYKHSIAFPDSTLEDTFFNLCAFTNTNRITTLEECLYSYLRRKFGSLSKNKAWNRVDIYKKRYRAFLLFLRKKNALTAMNHAKAFYCFASRLFYIIYVAIVSKQ